MKGSEKIAMLRKAIEVLRPKEHYHVEEDSWYSCPLHPDAVHRQDPTWDDKCQCLFETTNDEINRILEATS